MSMPATRPYPIGRPGVPWGPADVEAWRARQVRHRSYAEDVLARVDAVAQRFDVARYGELNYGGGHFPLVAVRSRNWQADRPCILVTGGVHGYETSGVLGALRFIERHAERYAGRVNLLMAPCVSPWAYERIQRWNHDAQDPNRCFRADSPAGECAALMGLIAPHHGRFLVHVDLHETTDSDESEFRPALAARDGKEFEPGTVPDGFYLVDDAGNPQPGFQRYILEQVEKVTHIAPADAKGDIIGSPVAAPGVILYPMKPLGLCAGISDARYTTTTEVYPDSPRVTPEACCEAQAVTACAAIDYALMHP